MKFKIATLFFLALTMAGCDINHSVKKDLITGSYSKGIGLTCDQINMDIDGKSENRNKFVFGEKVNFVFGNLSGFTQKNNRVFPGMSLVIIKNGKDTVSQNLDLLSDMKNGTNLSPLQLNAFFTANLQYRDNESYKLFIKIWDKKGKGKFMYEMPFKVVQNKFLKIKSQGINYSSIYLWDETAQKTITGDKIEVDNKLILIFEGLEGFSNRDGKVYPSMMLDISDNAGRSILYTENVLDDYSSAGVDANMLRDEQLPIIVTFDKGLMTNPCKLKTTLSDMNSAKQLVVSGEFVID